MALSSLGFALLAFDKVSIQGIQYFEGLGRARYEWATIAAERDFGISSVWTIMGYGIGNAYFVTMMLAVTQRTTISRRLKLAALEFCIVIVILHSALTGGRSGILLLVAVFVASIAAVSSGVRLRSLVPKQWSRVLACLGVLSMVLYSAYIVYSRASMSAMNPQTYAVEGLSHLGLEIDAGFRGLVGEGTLGDAAHVAIFMIAYLTHSFSTCAAIMEHAGTVAPHLFLPGIGYYLSRLGIIGGYDSQEFFSGLLPSLPGQLWYHFDGVSFGVLSLALGLISGSVLSWKDHSPNKLLPLVAVSLVGSILILSPYCLAVELMWFPFIPVGVVAMIAIDFLLRAIAWRTTAVRLIKV